MFLILRTLSDTQTAANKLEFDLAPVFVGIVNSYPINDVGALASLD
jgi:hypothetical protein